MINLKLWPNQYFNKWTLLYHSLSFTKIGAKQGVLAGRHHAVFCGNVVPNLQ